MIFEKDKFLKEVISFKILSIFRVIMEIKSLLFHGHISTRFLSLQERFSNGFFLSVLQLFLGMDFLRLNLHSMCLIESSSLV